MRSKILSNEERDSIFNLNYGDEELVRYFTPNNADLTKIERINKDYNKIGYLIYKHILQSKGFTTVTFDWDIPKNLVEYVSLKIGVDNVDLSKYSRTVRLKDLKDIMKELGYKKFKLTDAVKQHAFQIAFTNATELEMMYDLIYYLRRERIALPAIGKLEKVIYDSIKEVEDYIYTNIVEQIDDKNAIEKFLEVREGRFSDYNIIKNTKSRGIEEIQTKIKILESYDVDIDLSFIPSQKLPKIYEDANNCTREAILRFKDNKKRLAYLVIFVKQELKRLEDKLIIIDREQEKNKYKKMVVTEGNIVRVYNQFINEVVLKKEEYKQGVLVSIFLDIVINGSSKGYIKIEEGYFQTSCEKIYIDKDKYKKFIDDVIIEKYTNAEKLNLIAVSDKLQDIAIRRAEGTYYTPRVWVNEASNMIEQAIGTDWKDKYVVWDSSSGVGNLTNGYIFKELYSSTLNEDDLKYVECGVKFQFDFLNDDIEKSHKIPSKLVQALEEDKPIIFLINPPYKASNDVIDVEGIRQVIPTTEVGKQMKECGLGISAHQLYSQFLYRILQIKKEYNLSNAHIALFAPTTYITGDRFSRFREIFLSEFDFKAGTLFSARNFNQIYGDWNISLGLWSIGKCKNKNEFIHLQKEVGADGKIFTKNITVLSNKD